MTTPSRRSSRLPSLGKGPTVAVDQTRPDSAICVEAAAESPGVTRGATATRVHLVGAPNRDSWVGPERPDDLSVGGFL
jgi:hypothetical protein